RVESFGYPRVAAVGCVEELHQVVGTDGKEIDPLEQFVKLEQERGNLDHGADLDPFGQFVPMPAQVRQFDLDQCLCLVEFLDDGDHWKHELEAAPARRTQQGTNLAAQQTRSIEAKPDRPPSQSRVFFIDVPHVWQHLVAADVERTECDWLLS